MQILQKLERILRENELQLLNEKGLSDSEIAKRYKITAADVLILRGWYGIKPIHIKPERCSANTSSKPRIKRPIRKFIKFWHERGNTHAINLLKDFRNNEIYEQYKMGESLTRLARLYFVTEQYLKSYITKRQRREAIQATEEYLKTKNKKLTKKILQNYKESGKTDYEISVLHDTSIAQVCKLRKYYGISGNKNPFFKFSGTLEVEILEKYRNGHTINELSSKYGIKQYFIQKLLKVKCTKNDKMQHYTSIYKPEEQKKLLLKLQKEHKTDTAIGKILGVTRQRVHQMRVKLGIPAFEQKKYNIPK